MRPAANISSTARVEAFASVPPENLPGPGPWKITSIELGLSGTAYIQTKDSTPLEFHALSRVPACSRTETSLVAQMKSKL
jgi:hypothetical protein